MRNGIAKGLALAVLAFLAVTASAQAPPMVWTKITLEELDCAGCVKKIAAKLGTVPGVSRVQGDIPAAVIWVLHQPALNPSPRAMWDAVEKADHTVVKMEGPAGTFTKKPPS